MWQLNLFLIHLVTNVVCIKIMWQPKHIKSKIEKHSTDDIFYKPIHKVGIHRTEPKSACNRARTQGVRQSDYMASSPQKYSPNAGQTKLQSAANNIHKLNGTSK